MRQMTVGNRAGRCRFPGSGGHGQERYDAAGMALLDDHAGVARPVGIGLYDSYPERRRNGRREISHHVRDAAQRDSHDTGDPNESLPVLQRPAEGKEGGDHVAIEPDTCSIVNAGRA